MRREDIPMTVTVCPITPSFAAEVGDVDLSGPLPPADLAAIKEAFARYAVLVFPGQHLSPEQHLDFAGQFGPLETTIAVHRGDSPLRLAKEFADVSNLDHNSELWGKDSRVRRGRLGFTNFSEQERRELPPVPQVMVRTIPESGRKSLYLASHAGRIFGMGDAEGRALIDELIAHATQRQFVYTHRWRVHDLVMWDNRCTMHRGTEFDDLRWKRDVQRATVCDVANSCEQEGIEVAAA